jgi:branched-chain amino acid transport system ATP-binding protein/urea transport system ATP-binding protein
MSRREIVLETRNLSMHFGGVRAVENVNFELQEKELRCLIGPNGAGKSTTFNLLTMDLKRTDGDIKLFGEQSDQLDLVQKGMFMGLCP